MAARDALDDVAHALGYGPEGNGRDLCPRQYPRRLAPDAHEAAFALADRHELDGALGEVARQLDERPQRLLAGLVHVIAAPSASNERSSPSISVAASALRPAAPCPRSAWESRARASPWAAAGWAAGP